MSFLKKWIRSPSIAGLLLAVVVFFVLMSVIFGITAWVSRWFDGEIPDRQLLVVFLLILVPMAVALVLIERPAGGEKALMRLGLATFCRTGLPFFCAVVITLVTEDGLHDHSWFFMAFFYIVGILLSVWISIVRFAGQAPGASRGLSVKSDEVDSAPVQ